MDIAQLGIEVRSNGTSKASSELNALTNAAKMADAASEGLSASTKNAGAAAQAASGGFQKATVAVKAHAAAVNDNLTKANVSVHRMGGSMSGLAAQFQDIGVTAAMGMNPVMIALQQGTQIAGQMEMAMQGGAKATTVFATAFRSLLSPVSLASIALTALAAAGLQMVNWTQRAADAIRGLANVLVAIAPYAATAVAGLALLYAPAIIGGIVSVIALLGRLAVAAVSAGVAIAAANPLGAFVLGVTAAVAAMNIFSDEITQIFGRDIVADVKNAANFVINSFEAAFEDIKFLWNQFPNIIGAAVIGAANAVITTLTDMVQRGANIIDTLRKKVNEYLPASLRSNMIGDLGISDFKLQDPYSGRLNDAWTDRNANIERIMGQDRVGQFGEAISRGASAASGKLQELAKWMTTVDEKKKRSGGKTDAENYADIVDGANRRIASLKAEELTLGMTEQAALSLRYETDLLNQAQQKGIALTAAQRAELNALAGQMAATEIATKKAREAVEFAKNTTLGFVNDLRNGLKNGEGFWKSFGNAAMNVLDRITDKLLGDVMDAIFQVNGAGGGGNWLSSIFGGLFGGGSQFRIASAGGIGMYADGTASARAGLAMVGERGPELVRFKGGETVIPNHHLRAANSNPSAGAVVVNFSPTINAHNADAEGLAQVRHELRQMKSEIGPLAVQAVQTAKKRNVKGL